MDNSDPTIAKLQQLIEEFRSILQERTKDPDNFLTMSELESLWRKLRGDTNVLYSNMVEELLRNIDEKKLVRKKNCVRRARNPVANQPKSRQRHPDA